MTLQRKQSIHENIQREYRTAPERPRLNIDAPDYDARAFRPRTDTSDGSEPSMDAKGLERAKLRKAAEVRRRFKGRLRRGAPAR